ncbi:hypothetical protein PWG14_27235, partial [Chromobacterium amazonense]|nr:hypothetical protein [Chromobacterium amazonense]
MDQTLRRWLPDAQHKLAACWLAAPHELAAGAGCGISLAALDRALAELDLAAILPAALARAVRKRQLSFLAGRLCAERALAELGYPNGAVGRTEPGLPQWPAGLIGSITHHGEAAYAVAAFASDYAALGMDSEQLARPSAARSIRSLCCTEREIQAWLGQRDDT